MILKFKKWILYLLLTTLTLYVIFLIILNYIVDIDNIFHSKKTNQGHIFGDIKFGKIEYLEKHHQLYNSYIIGGSRSGIIQGKDLETYIKNSKFYNLSVTSSTIEDSYLLVKYIIGNYNVKNILLQISAADLQPTISLSRKLHYKISDKNKFLYFCSYLLSKDIKHTFDLFRAQKIPAAYYHKPTNTDGSWDHSEIESFITKKKSEYFTDLFKIPQEKRYIKNIYTGSTLCYLQMIENCCELHNVNLYVYFVPDHHFYLDLFDIDSYYNFLKGISKISNFWFFGGYNSITTNDTNYYDVIHYRHFIADQIVKKMFSDSICEPKDFGIYITASNIDQTIDFLKKQFISWDNDHSK